MKAVFFDLDNTLIDHSSAERAAALSFYETVRDRARAESAAAFALLWNRVLEAQIRRYFAGELTFQGQRRARIRDVLTTPVTDTEADVLFAVYLTHYEANWRAFPDALECLDLLDVEHVGVITNGDPEQQRRKLARTGLAGRLPVLVCSGDVGCAKPDQRIFLHACQQLGVRPSEAAHVGDSLASDYEGACGAGLRGVLLVRGGSASGPPSATRVHTLAEIPGILCRARGT